MNVTFRQIMSVKGKKLAFDMKIESSIHFIPQIGMDIVVVPDDDYRPVETVQWHPIDGLTVWFVDSDDYHPKLFKQFKKLGWKEDA